MKRYILVLCLAFMPLAPAAADPAADIQHALTRKQQEHAETQKKANKINKEVQKLRTKLVETGKRVRTSETALTDIEKQLKKLEKESALYTEQFYAEQDKLGGMMTAARRYHATTIPHHLLRGEPVEAARTARIMKSVIPQLQENADSLRQRLSDIRKVESRIEKRLREREREHKKYRSEEKELADLIEKRRALYRQTEGARQKQEAALKKLALEAKSIEDLILKIDSHAAAGRKPPPPRTAFAPAKPPSKSRPAAKRTTAAGPLPRNMTAPVAGTVRIAYGQTDDLGAKSLGISYDVRAGAAVVAPLGGTVRFAGPFQKFKQILIVEHKDGYHSLIAGLGRIDTVVGAALAAGEPVGTAERSAGTQTIYYELRRNGTPVNPANAMAARKG